MTGMGRVIITPEITGYYYKKLTNQIGELFHGYPSTHKEKEKSLYLIKYVMYDNTNNIHV